MYKFIAKKEQAHFEEKFDPKLENWSFAVSPKELQSMQPQPKNAKIEFMKLYRFRRFAYYVFKETISEERFVVYTADNHSSSGMSGGMATLKNTDLYDYIHRDFPQYTKDFIQSRFSATI